MTTQNIYEGEGTPNFVRLQRTLTPLNAVGLVLKGLKRRILTQN